LPGDVLVEPFQGLIARQDTSGHLPPKAEGSVLQLAMKSLDMATQRA
jgi:hypothetical protein